MLLSALGGAVREWGICSAGHALHSVGGSLCDKRGVLMALLTTGPECLQLETKLEYTAGTLSGSWAAGTGGRQPGWAGGAGLGGSWPRSLSQVPVPWDGCCSGAWRLTHVSVCLPLPENTQV